MYLSSKEKLPRLSYANMGKKHRINANNGKSLIGIDDVKIRNAIPGKRGCVFVPIDVGCETWLAKIE